MKLKIFSDLHLDAGNKARPSEGAEDVVVVPGDLFNDTGRGLDWLAGNFGSKETIFVPGNHEYYGSSLSEADDDMVSFGKACGIKVLINKSVVIDGIKFIGTTLWSDFMLYGGIGMALAMRMSEKYVNDFQNISINRTRKLSAGYVSGILHKQAIDFLRAELKDSDPNKTVVVTHFAPCSKSVARPYVNDPITPYFVNNHDSLIPQAKLWIHGHCHTAFDYAAGDSRVICNPGGYRGEHTGFNPDLIVEV